jgi:hypothetical protein
MGNDQIVRIDWAIPKLHQACDREWKIMLDEEAAGTAGSEAWQNAHSNLDGNMQHLAALKRVRLELCAGQANDNRPCGGSAPTQAKSGLEWATRQLFQPSAS